MPGIKDLSSIWKNIKEIDLKPIRESATYPVRIVLVGAPESGRHTLAEQMRTDPARPGIHTQSTLALIATDAITEAPVAHLIIVLIDATRTDISEEQALVKRWSEAGKNVLVFFNKIDLVDSNLVSDVQSGWLAGRVIYGSVNDITYLQREFVPTVLEMLPQQHVALGRQFPLFRLPVARQLINEACFSNAAYSFSTGLAEIIPVLDLPLNVTDMIVLTKSQAFLAYKLGLLLGFSTRWQDYVTEFGGVIGSGFLWRQIARQLVGLIPAWGIAPKVAVAYSGTYVVGNAILGWYLTGKNLTPKQMRALYAQAFTRGREYAHKLADKLPKPRPGKRKREQLPSPTRTPELDQGEIVITKSPTTEVSAPAMTDSSTAVVSPQEEVASSMQMSIKAGKAKKVRPPKKGLVGWRNRKTPASLEEGRICPACGKISSADAIFCQYCATRLYG
ncbi:MAG TPA: hypothetical protein VLD65_10650 [Anaerolineales bacterium]|nr:hypothetical protein [Anaerolineales bacterium]